MAYPTPTHVSLRSTVPALSFGARLQDAGEPRVCSASHREVTISIWICAYGSAAMICFGAYNSVGLRLWPLWYPPCSVRSLCGNPPCTNPLFWPRPFSPLIPLALALAFDLSRWLEFARECSLAYVVQREIARSLEGTSLWASSRRYIFKEPGECRLFRVFN